MREIGGDRRGRWSWLLAALVACGGADETIAPPDPIAPGAETPIGGELAEIAGDHAVATVFVRLERWPEVRDALRGALASEPPEEIRDLLTLPLVDALRSMRASDMADALASLRGVDTARPMVFRFAETTDDGLERVLEAAREGARSQRSTGALRHVLAIPASDPVALERSLRVALGHLCREVDGELRCPDGWAPRIEADGDWVFAVFGELEAPLRGSGEASATLRWAMDRRWPAAAHLRQSAMRGAAVETGVRQIRRALGNVASDYANQLLAGGLVEVLGAHALTTSRSAEVSEAAIAVRPDPASLVFIGRLTPKATDALAAAGPVRDPAPGPRTEHQHLEIRSSLPLPAAARAVPPPFAVPRGTPNDALIALLRCGPFCLFGSMAQPLSVARLATDIGAMDAFAEHVRYVPIRGERGSLEADLDVAGFARAAGGRGPREIAQLVPALHLRARVEGSTLAGALGFRPALPFALPELEPGASPRVDPEQLRCLERIEVESLQALHAVAQAPPELRAQLVEAGATEASEHLRCITAPELRSEAEAYLAAMRAIGSLADPPPSERPEAP